MFLDSRGFYRTNYNVSDWKTIAEMLNKDPEVDFRKFVGHFITHLLNVPS